MSTCIISLLTEFQISCTTMFNSDFRYYILCNLVNCTSGCCSNQCMFIKLIFESTRSLVEYLNSPVLVAGGKPGGLTQKPAETSIDWKSIAHTGLGL